MPLPVPAPPRAMRAMSGAPVRLRPSRDGAGRRLHDGTGNWTGNWTGNASPVDQDMRRQVDAAV
ncbi:hypothetical protein [Nonomuraea sp. NPDC050202]|uniref:hypothetical protein n=1 Tax=Nonomuraea sp. NPDC050202 TaxID=3155035 RepID=UPI0033C7E068